MGCVPALTLCGWASQPRDLFICRVQPARQPTGGTGRSSRRWLRACLCSWRSFPAGEGVSLASCAPGAGSASLSPAQTLSISLFHLQSEGKHVCCRRISGSGDLFPAGTGPEGWGARPETC